MTSLFEIENKNADYSGLPQWMVDGELFSGTVPSECQKRTSLPNVPLMCMPPQPEFLQAVNLLLASPDTTAYGANNKCFMAEATISGVRYTVARNGNGKILAMRNGAPLTGKKELPGRMVFLLSMAYYMSNAEFAALWERLVQANDDVERKVCVGTMYDYAYCLDGTNVVTNSFDASASLLALTQTKAKSAGYMPSTQVGTFTEFQNVGTNAATSVPASIKATKSVMSGSQFNGAYRVVEESELTAEERSHIFLLDDRYNITAQHIDVAQTIKGSLGGPHPFCNYLFRGQPGGGKSTFVQILAAGLGLPFYSDVLRDDLSGDFFSGYYAPDVDGKTHSKYMGLDEFLASMPSPEDMTYDPITSYETITGTIKDDATAQDCMLAMSTKVVEFTKGIKGESKNALTFIEGLVPKLARPSLIFYDEVTAPKNPAAITALNALMDRQRVFTLSTGRVIHRHPLSVMCFAGNFSEDGIELEGAHDPNRTWQDRNNEILNIDPPKPADIKAMLISDTGYDETANANIDIDMFVSILPELQKVSADYYGVCGFRALSDWLAKSMVLGSPLRAAETTIITKSSNDKDCQGELRMKIQNRFKF